MVVSKVPMSVDWRVARTAVKLVEWKADWSVDKTVESTVARRVAMTAEL